MEILQELWLEKHWILDHTGDLITFLLTALLTK